MASDLSRSLVDAAAAAAADHIEQWPLPSDAWWVSVVVPDLPNIGRAAVAAVLETLAAHCDPVPVSDGSTSQALLANTELRALARAVLGEKEETADGQ